MENTTPSIGRPYTPAASAPASAAQRATVERLVAAATWAEPRYLADGTAEVAVLNGCGIIERIVTVFADGSHT